jgi:hypothetical protein
MRRGLSALAPKQEKVAIEQTCGHQRINIHGATQPRKTYDRGRNVETKDSWVRTWTGNTYAGTASKLSRTGRRPAYGAWSIFAIAQEACHCGGGPATIDLGKMGCLRLLAAVLSVVRLVPLYFPERLDR